MVTYQRIRCCQRIRPFVSVFSVFCHFAASKTAWKGFKFSILSFVSGKNSVKKSSNFLQICFKLVWTAWNVKTQILTKLSAFHAEDPFFSAFVTLISNFVHRFHAASQFVSAANCVERNETICNWVFNCIFREYWEDYLFSDLTRLAAQDGEDLHGGA